MVFETFGWGALLGMSGEPDYGLMQLEIFETDPDELDLAATQDYRAERNVARSAEYLVAFDISRRGWGCFMAGEGLRYDLIADVGGLRRVQVKMNHRAIHRAPGSVALSYTFGNRQDLREYRNDVDLFAFVGMDRMVILYVRPDSIRRQQAHIAAAVMTPEMAELSWAEALRSWGIE